MFGGDKSEIEKAVFKNIENRPKSIDSSDYLEELYVPHKVVGAL